VVLIALCAGLVIGTALIEQASKGAMKAPHPSCCGPFSGDPEDIIEP
jgi:hypothetical protein